MGEYTQPAEVKLVVGLLGKNEETIREASAILGETYGPEETVLSPIPFTWTNYYEKEVGPNPLRSFIAYESTIARELIVEIKRRTNSIEESLSIHGLRPVNLDPGYLTLGQFFLASTKDQRQRVYLGNGIFLEPTLFFKDGEFYPFDWTYRDYRSKQYLEYFKLARSRLAYQLKHGRPHSSRKRGTNIFRD